MPTRLAGAASNYAAVAGGLSIESLTYYMFWIATVCMGAGTWVSH